VTGSLDFTERGARLPGATADVYGMPVRFGVDVKGDGTVVVEARGRAAADRLREQFRHPLLAKLAGETDWRAMASVKGDRGEVSVDADLRGMAIDLPAPVGKAAADVAPLRYQRKWRDVELTQTLTVADRVSLATVGAPGDAPGAFRRAAVDLGGGTTATRGSQPSRRSVRTPRAVEADRCRPSASTCDSARPASSGASSTRSR
jgi:uncharacterized protein YhdP